VTPRAVAELCGELLVGGFDGLELPRPVERSLVEGRQAGVIFFKRNIESVEAAGALTRAVLSASRDREPPFICVDQEGGRVQRLPEPIVQLPPMRALGDAGDPELAELAGRVLGAELRAAGFNVDFAPVLDVDSNPGNPVIGDRSFGATPAQVIEMAGAFARGLQSAGVLACGKHFPGHGDTELDSHLALPFVAHGRERLDAVELAPFVALKGVVGSMMTAHVVFSALDPERPATLSSKVVTDLLRREIGYAGLVFSDDLEMRAIADRQPAEEAAVEAIAAGCDVLLVCKSLELLERTHEALVREAERSPAFAARCSEAATRSVAARRRFPPAPFDEEALRRVLTGADAARLRAAFAG
jgi:beta-N-acetylhexosaminidase